MNNLYPMQINTGLKIITSEHFVEDGPPIQVARTWRERFLTRPWRPWEATRTVIPKVPMRCAYQLPDGTLTMHPETFRRMIKEQKP